MFCRSCGSQVRNGVKFCPACGSAMSTARDAAAGDAPQPDAAPMSPAATQPAATSRSRSRWTSALVICVIIGALAGGGALASHMGLLGKPTTVSSADATNSTPADAAKTTESDAVESTMATETNVAAGVATALELGSSERSAIMDAIHTWRGTTKATEPLYVNRANRIYMQDDYAVCDIATSAEGSNRMFVVLEGTPWDIVWSAGYHSSKAKESALKSAVPDIPARLLAKIEWDLDWKVRK